MNKKELRKRKIIYVFLIIIILLIHSVTLLFNLSNMINSEDSVSRLIGGFGSMILPYSFISIITQIIELIVAIFNKIKKQISNILELIIETIYFIFMNITCMPIMFLNSINSFLLMLSLIILEIINVYIFILIVKGVIICKREANNE